MSVSVGGRDFRGNSNEYLMWREDMVCISEHTWVLLITTKFSKNRGNCVHKIWSTSLLFQFRCYRVIVNITLVSDSEMWLLSTLIYDNWLTEATSKEKTSINSIFPMYLRCIFLNKIQCERNYSYSYYILSDTYVGKVIPRAWNQNVDSIWTH